MWHRVPGNSGKPGKRVLLFPVRETPGNSRKMLQGKFREFHWPKWERGQSVIDSFSNIIFTLAYGVERFAESWQVLRGHSSVT